MSLHFLKQTICRRHTAQSTKQFKLRIEPNTEHRQRDSGKLFGCRAVLWQYGVQLLVLLALYMAVNTLPATLVRHLFVSACVSACNAVMHRDAPSPISRPLSLSPPLTHSLTGHFPF